MEAHNPIIAAGLTPDSCYRALVARDTRFDGMFFTGVKTTGIYCRPVCGVKTPQRSSCVFFGSAAAAEAAGFRPCLRCRPELAPYALQQHLAHAVWQRIAAGALNDGDSERLAEEVGLSSRQLRRVLLQHFGVTPIELAQTQRLLFAKKLLQETTLPMSEVAHASGFGSIRRFNALFQKRYGMVPGDIRRATEAPRRAVEDTLTLRLAYRPPLAWHMMLSYLSARAIPGVEAVIRSKEGWRYMRCVRYQDVQGWFMARQHASKDVLEITLSTSLAPVLMPLMAQVRALFDLDAQPDVIAAHLADDPLLETRIKQTPGLRVPGALDAFELAIRAVLGQQVSVAGATTLVGRLVERFGMPFMTPYSELTHQFPTAQDLATRDATDIATIGLPLSRAQTLCALAQFAASNGFRLRPGLNLQDVVAQLRTVHGIGEWTAQYIALRALRYADAFPAGDLVLQKVAAKGGVRLTEKQLLACAAHWSPWRAYAAMLLWQYPESSSAISAVKEKT